ncbi:hypothetical protein [Streptomyces sp. 039-1]|uniref:hypothetical protein n=1 Tax=Streptomyces sp. 039-1 TaxID=2789263 RepID=UPI0039F56FAE
MPDNHPALTRREEGEGWRIAYGNAAQLEAELTKQANTAYAEAPDPASIAAAEHSALAVQPLVLDVRARILADTIYLEGILADARVRGLAPELIEQLEAVVDHGHALSVLLADTARTTAAHAD